MEYQKGNGVWIHSKRTLNTTFSFTTFNYLEKQLNVLSLSFVHIKENSLCKQSLEKTPRVSDAYIGTQNYVLTVSVFFSSITDILRFSELSITTPNL